MLIHLFIDLIERVYPVNAAHVALVPQHLSIKVSSS